jgi:hypothetical protein
MPDFRKIAFISKYRHASGGYPGASYGLINSSRFVSRYLTDHTKIRSEVFEAVDANDIDRIVTSYNARHVVLEALWVTPEKLHELATLSRNVVRDRRWVVRVHSKLPFLANEGIALDWILKIRDYNLANVIVAANTAELARDLSDLGVRSKYLPNIYEPKNVVFARKPLDAYLDIGCFGAIRPLKNHLTQAVAAVRFANHVGRRLRFHVNSSRIEQKGDNNLKNLRALFDSGTHLLFEHDWTDHQTFVNVVRRMDFGMQVSLSETFNIVAADFVANGVPVVVSPEIAWVPKQLQADPNSTDSIESTLRKVAGYNRSSVATLQLDYLRSWNTGAAREWKNYWLGTF